MVEGSLELKVIKGVSAALGNSLSDEVKSRLSASMAADFSIQHLPISSQFSSEGFTEACLIPVCGQNAAIGMIVLLNTPSTEQHDCTKYRKNILFLIEQSLRAFENAETFSKAKDLLFIDDVSGLYNHRYLDIALDREMKRVERYASHLAVLFIDVDSFKQVNDIHGHMVGSRVLAEFGALVKKSVRDVDIVIRYGGDEYTAILVETSCMTAELVAERIRRQVESHHFSGDDGKIIRLTCSIGYACCPEDTASKDKLLEMADKAMYVGKTSGKNCVQRVARGI